MTLKRKIKIWYRRVFAYREDYLLAKKFAQINNRRWNMLSKRQMLRVF